MSTIVVSPAKFAARVDGQPQPKARARVFATNSGKIRAVTPDRTRDAEYAIAWALKAAWRQDVDATSLFEVRCLFVFSPTKAGDARRVDGDNCLKAVLDAGNIVVWKDDSQVRRAAYEVEFGDEPRTEVTFWRLT